MHQLAMSAEKRWRRLRGFRHLADVIVDVRFIDGVDEKETGKRAAGLGRPFSSNPSLCLSLTVISVFANLLPLLEPI